MSDTVAALQRGKAAVVVITQEFTGLAKVVAKQQGWPGMRRVVLPYPLTELSEDDLRAIAHAHLDQLLEAIGLVPG